MTYEGRISKITDYLIIDEGNISNEYTTTPHGTALNISGRGIGQISLSIYQKEDYQLEDKYPILSLDKQYVSSGIYDGTEENAEYYCCLYWNSNNSIHISINLEVEHINKAAGVANEFRQTQSIEGNLYSGWNIITGNKSTIGT